MKQARELNLPTTSAPCSVILYATCGRHGRTQKGLVPINGIFEAMVLRSLNPHPNLGRLSTNQFTTVGPGAFLDRNAFSWDLKPWEADRMITKARCYALAERLRIRKRAPMPVWILRCNLRRGIRWETQREVHLDGNPYFCDAAIPSMSFSGELDGIAKFGTGVTTVRSRAARERPALIARKFRQPTGTAAATSTRSAIRLHRQPR